MAAINIDLVRQVPNIASSMSKAYLTGYKRVSGNSMEISIKTREITATTLTVYVITGADL